MNYEEFRRMVLEERVDLSEEENGSSVEPSDDTLYQEYQDVLSGEAARRRAIEDASEEQRETEREWRAWAEHTGSPLPRNFEG